MEAYLGTIVAWAPSYPPKGWLFCGGQMLKIRDYTALFSLIGTTYGGNGDDTFALPNLSGRVVVGAHTGDGMGGSLPPGNTSYRIGETGGANFVTLTTQQMPAHTHQATTSTSGLSVSGLTVKLPASTSGANTASPSNDASLATSQGPMGPTPIYTTGQTNTYLKPATVSGGTISGTVTTTISPAGSSAPTPIDVRQPYSALNYIICVEGYYPPRPE
ncbi:phage tail protein [Bacillus horti]|uniref:Microcystin-dependent protein n=1 Tax=Caldalkalibacillus horti TaxID=77523 RepID=A0ABT9VYX7_9BACI|nr:tail fiber protein [Bacillus horti]MDQ0166196.1 microcystin-dependent protein [Bacillus horti]